MHTWIIESNFTGRWEPCEYCFVSRRDARLSVDSMRKQFPGETFRVKKYLQSGKLRLLRGNGVAWIVEYRVPEVVDWKTAGPCFCRKRDALGEAKFLRNSYTSAKYRVSRYIREPW